MNGWLNNFIENNVQCWGCGVFDKLIQMVSGITSGVYSSVSQICIFLFVLLFTIFVFNAFWKNLKTDAKDPMFSKSIQKVVINSLVCMVLLGSGVLFPRVVTTVIFEPVAEITTLYSQAMISLDSSQVNERVTYVPTDMADDEIYRPEFRDKLIQLMKTTVTQFQSYIKLGVALMDNAFSWENLFSGPSNILGSLIKNLLLFFIGLFLSWEFIKLFLRYCFYFADTVIAMAFFALFFPLSLVTMAFKDAEHVPGWIGNIGKSLGAQQIKKLISSIVTLASAVIGYTVIMVIIAKFFSSPDVESSGLVNAITTGEIYSESLSMNNFQSMTLFTFVAMLFVLKYVFAQIPEITKMILSAFAVQTENTHSEKMATFAKEVVQGTKKLTTSLGKIILKKDTTTATSKPSKTE